MFDSFGRKKENAGAEAQERWQIGDRIENRYEIHDIKGGEGKSGFGIVYICYDHGNKVPLAIKTFQAKFLHSQKARDDFTQEALRWTKLDKHKNIVRAYTVKNIEGQLYIFLEYVAGGNLDDWLYTQMLDLPLALNFAIQFCNGMEHAYNKMKLVHRDIKPGNILLTKDKTIKITDFGLAKAIEAKAEPIAVPQDVSYIQSSTAGTFPYMAPEQFTMYLFSWDEIPGNNSGRLIDFLKQNYSIDWVKTAKIGKIDDGKTIKVSIEKNSLSLKLNDEKTEVNLKIDDGRADKFIVKTENGKLNIYTIKEIGTRADIYAFGIVLYQMVTNSYPYPRKSSWEEMHLGESPIPIKQNIPHELNVLIHKCLEKEPSKRYQNFSELKQELSKIYFDLTGEKIIEEPPVELEAGELNNKGCALDNLGRHQEAVACCDKALEINPRYAGAWNTKGAVLRNLGKLQEALACYDKALEINPRHAEAWKNKGAALGELGKLQEALACCDKALEINPRYAEAWYNKGVALCILGKLQEALACYDKALEINPRHVEAWNNKGSTLLNSDKLQEALACYDKALEINPRHVEAWNNKGTALGELGRLQEALTCHDKVLEINPRHVTAWYNKGNALGNLGRHQEAVACYDKALEINPRYVKAWNNKGIALVNLGRHQEAIYSFQKFIEFAPPQYASHVKKVEERIRQLKERV